jgi:hypothetical protein
LQSLKDKTVSAKRTATFCDNSLAPLLLSFLFQMKKSKNKSYTVKTAKFGQA